MQHATKPLRLFSLRQFHRGESIVLPAEHLVPSLIIFGGRGQEHGGEEGDHRAHAHEEEVVEIVDLEALEEQGAENLDEHCGEDVTDSCGAHNHASVLLAKDFSTLGCWKEKIDALIIFSFCLINH